MAKAQGVSHSTVHRIWDAHGLQPQRTKRFKLSKDIHFTEKLTDVVGLYLNPPDKAIVLCVDEKSQIQALQRTQPGLPMKKGRCGTTDRGKEVKVTGNEVLLTYTMPMPTDGVLQEGTTVLDIVQYGGR